jgi:uncharacterized membrane protein
VHKTAPCLIFAGKSFFMKRLSELSLEELLHSKARMTGILIAYAIVVLILIAVYLYIRFVMSRSITFIPFSVLPILWIPIGISLKNITDEINERQSYIKNNRSER